MSEAGACFKRFGDPQYWRQLTTGRNGDALWTNAFDSWAPGNWAEWRINLQEAGRYRVEAYMQGEARNPKQL